MTATLELPESLADRFASASPEVRAHALRQLAPEKQLELLNGTPWWFHGRSDQFAPPGFWRFWAINAGRGWGKTRTGAEWLADKMRRYPGCSCAMVAPTYTDARETMMEGISGLLSVVKAEELEGGSFEKGWKISRGQLHFANGSIARLFTSEKPMRLRGPQHHFAWGDEPSYWRDVDRGTVKDSTFSNLNIGLRNKRLPLWPTFTPQAILTMTPRMVPLLKVDDETLAADEERAGILQRKDTVITTGATVANLRNLDQAYYDAVIRPMLGTTLGLQELGGVLLEEVDGALWTRLMIELDRVEELPELDSLSGTLVAFDPSGGKGATRDEHGVVVVSSTGYQQDRQFYVRADRSLNGTPDDAAETVILAALEFDADRIVFEKNQGQDWIPSVIRSRFAVMKAAKNSPIPDGWRLPPLEPVDASKNKLQRASPLRGFYQQHRVHHVGRLPTLESQMVSWIPGESDSPDRLDALVWAVQYLYESGASRADIASPASRERRGRRANAPSSRLPSVYGYRTGR